jgi:hypothetical protein
MVYKYNYHNSGHYSLSCLLFKTRRFRNWILSPSQVEPTQLVPINRTSLYLLTPAEEVNLRPTVSRPVCLGFGFPSEAQDQVFVFYLTVAGFLMWGALSDERMCLTLLVQLLLGLARAVALGFKSCRTHYHILLSHLRLPQPGGPGPRIYIPGSLFVASYDSQGYLRWRYSNPRLGGRETGTEQWLYWVYKLCWCRDTGNNTTTPAGFINPTPQTANESYHFRTLNLHTWWSLTSICMPCFMDNFGKKILSE